MLVSGILRLRSLKRVKSFYVPDNARGYVVASNARARLVSQHSSGWFCHKCGACNPVGNDACFCCGTAYDAVQSENTYRQALEKYSHVINMMK